MSSFIVYSCQCYNIKVHLSTKYTSENFEELKKNAHVETPVTGWEFELGMGGIVTEFSSLVQSKNITLGWKTFSCLNCECGDVYSITDQTSSSHVIIHENAIYGKDIDKVKQSKEFSKRFKIKFIDDNHPENSIPMPSVEDVPGKLVSTHNQIQTSMEQSAEKLRLESKARIEEFKQQEEKKLQELLSNSKKENDRLWSKIIQVTNTNNDSSKKEKSHVRFASVEEEDQKPSVKKTNFDLDESTISSSLKNVHLSDLKLNLDDQLVDNEEEEEEEEEDMFNLDEEFSDEEEKEKTNEKDEEDKEEENKEEVDNNKKDQLISSSFKKSVSEIDQKFSWIKKKRNTNKYLTQDFDIKSDFKRDNSKNEEEPSAISMFATSVPITIHYRAPEEEEVKEDQDSPPRKKDILASSFANYDFSYSDRMLSEQFPAPRRRKSLASTSLINPQLDSLVGKSLDTRGLMKKKKNEAEPKDDKEDFDSSLPPHIWAAMESIDE